MSEPTTAITPFLMFEGRAEDAMNLYISLFDDGEVVHLHRHPDHAGEAAGKIMVATFRIAGLLVRCSDSPIHHDFTFTPATSLFVDCTSEEQLVRLHDALSEDGGVLMPVDDYGFSRRFCWVADRFGVSWQLNLP